MIFTFTAYAASRIISLLKMFKYVKWWNGCYLNYIQYYWMTPFIFGSMTTNNCPIYIFLYFNFSLVSIINISKIFCKFCMGNPNWCIMYSEL